MSCRRNSTPVGTDTCPHPCDPLHVRPWRGNVTGDDRSQITRNYPRSSRDSIFWPATCKTLPACHAAAWMRFLFISPMAMTVLSFPYLIEYVASTSSGMFSVRGSLVWEACVTWR